MRKLIESTFVTLGGDISAPQEWGWPYLNCPDGDALNRELLFGADALLLGRRTYEGLSAGYLGMTPEPGEPGADFVARMNSLPKYVASTTLRETRWNASLLEGDVADRVAELKKEPGGTILKYGTGPLDATLLAHGLIDELHLWLVPVTIGPGQRLFENVADTSLALTRTRTLSTGVVVLTYEPANGAPGRPDA